MIERLKKHFMPAQGNVPINLEGYMLLGRSSEFIPNCEEGGMMVLNCPECSSEFGYIKKSFRIYSWNMFQWINRHILKTYPLIEDCGRCRDCGRNVHDFHVPNALWNEVITGSPIIYLNDGITPSREGAGGVWCYDCFANRADERLGMKWRMELVEKWTSIHSSNGEGGK